MCRANAEGTVPSSILPEGMRSSRQGLVCYDSVTPVSRTDGNRSPSRSLICVLPILAAAACQSAGQASFNIPIGAYAGLGKFSGVTGSMKVEGRLTLDADGSYSLAMKPSLLDRETGTYRTDGQTLHLQPAPPETKTDAYGRPNLASALQRSVQPRTMTLSAGFRSVSWSDGPMSLEMSR